MTAPELMRCPNCGAMVAAIRKSVPGRLMRLHDGRRPRLVHQKRWTRTPAPHNCPGGK